MDGTNSIRRLQVAVVLAAEPLIADALAIREFCGSLAQLSRIYCAEDTWAHKLLRLLQRQHKQFSKCTVHVLPKHSGGDGGRFAWENFQSNSFTISVDELFPGLSEPIRLQTSTSGLGVHELSITAPFDHSPPRVRYDGGKWW